MIDASYSVYQGGGRDLAGARWGTALAGWDLLIQLCLLAVEAELGNFGTRPNRYLSCPPRWVAWSTDANTGEGRDQAGGPSPTLFAYTHPSDAAIGEMAHPIIRSPANLLLFGGHPSCEPNRTNAQ